MIFRCVVIDSPGDVTDCNCSYKTTLNTVRHTARQLPQEVLQVVQRHVNFIVASVNTTINLKENVHVTKQKRLR